MLAVRRGMCPHGPGRPFGDWGPVVGAAVVVAFGKAFLGRDIPKACSNALVLRAVTNEIKYRKKIQTNGIFTNTGRR